MWLSILFTCICIVVVSHYLQRKWKSVVQHQPPGPIGLPLVGYSLYLKPTTIKGLMRLKQDYPHIAQVDLGLESMIVLNSYTAIKEALVTKGANFSGRPKNIFTNEADLAQGISGSEGNFWKTHRRFGMRTLRDFGLGKNLAEEIVQRESQNLVKHMQQEMVQGRQCMNMLELLPRSVSNVICTIAMGEQPGYEDNQFSEVMGKVRENFNDFTMSSPALMYKSVFRHFTSLMALIPSVKRVVANVVATVMYLQTKIDDHVNNYQPGEESRDYIEAFLHEKHRLDAEGDTNHTFTPAELRSEVFELFIAGTDTTSNTLSWGLLLLAIHDDIQSKCYEEIHSVIGEERVVSMRDKDQMPYIQAVIDEIHRYASIVPTGSVHRSFEDDTLQGYHIPQNSTILPFVYGVHHDPQVWEKPDEFYPQHFLTTAAEDGKVAYKSRQELIPFLVGPRACMGESLAKMELFIFFVTLLQKYRVSLPEKYFSRVDEILTGTNGIIRVPGPHEILFYSRV